MAKFKGKYRIESTRATWWNYGWDAAYFITICTKNREHYFGEIGPVGRVEARLIAPLPDQPDQPFMQLSEIGQIAQACWDDIPNHFPFAKLGEFVVMPNHVHGIIIIDKSQLDGNVNTRLIAYPPPATYPPENQPIGGFSGNKNPMLNDNLSRIIRWFKGRTTFESRKICTHFAWQSLFHDHIIRDDEAYQRITTYIRNNPVKWRD